MPLLSLRLLVSLLAFAAASLALAVARARLGGKQRWVRTAAWGALAALLAAAGAGVSLNRHFLLYHSWSQLLGVRSPDLVHADDPRALARALAPGPEGSPAEKHGRLLSLTIPSTSSQLSAGRVLVYLPPQYSVAALRRRGFPVVEAIPGSPGRPVDFINGLELDRQLDTAMAAGGLPPAIVVMPPSNTSVFRSLECTDTADGKRDETYLTRDVHRWVTATLATDRKRWVALGYSTGGYCALDLALRHPELYARAVSLDGYVHALQDHYARGLWPAGSAGELARLEHSPDWWVANHRPEPVDVYLAAGTEDRDATRAAGAFWLDLVRARWLSTADRRVIEPNGHHNFLAWMDALLPALTWALEPEPASTARS